MAEPTDDTAKSAEKAYAEAKVDPVFKEYAF